MYFLLSKWPGSDSLALLTFTLASATDYLDGRPGIRSARFARTKATDKENNEKLLKNWIDRKLVDHEALSRHYERIPDFKDKISRYNDQLLKRKFINKAIIPKIDISNKKLEDYYLAHQKDFLKPTRFKIQQITVKTMDDARDVLNNLENGADFSWLAKRKSTDPAAKKGGNVGWFTREQLPDSAKEAVDSLKPGEISPILKIDSQFRIIRLQERSEEEVEAFDKVIAAVRKAYFNEQFNDIYSDFISRLREEAQIKIFDDKVRLFEEKLMK